MNTSIQANGEAMPFESPILAMARRLRRIRAEYELFGDEGLKAKRKEDSRAASIFERAGNNRYDEELVLREAISFELAASVSDAAIQAAELANIFDLLIDSVPEEAATCEFKRDTRAALRLMYSVFHFLDNASIERVSTIVDEHFGAPKHSPWLHPSETIAFYVADDEKAVRT